MTGVRGCLVVCAFLLTLVTAVPVLESRNEEGRIILLPRQAGSSCSQRSDCFPDDISDVPMTLIDCVNQRCACADCFTRNTTGQCGMTVPSPATCYYYDEPSLTCIDNRKSQIVAFALSLTLAGFGVANFYIGQDGLGAGQLVLFLSIFIILCSVICTPLCIFCCIQSDSLKGSIVFVCFMILMVILVFAVFIGIWAWWITDAVIFGTNNRNAGDGCPLKPDL